MASRRGRSPRSSACATTTGEGVLVGGTTATLADFDDLVSGSMWKIVLFVLGLSYLVLLVLLRSVLLPLKAVLMNVLSVGAAYGVLALVFGDVDTITPPLVLAVVFGLSMDYEVFLLTRIRERWLATGDTQRAVAEGLATSARTITSAALIMVAVFLVFVGTGLPSIQQIGLGCAVAIAVDATLVRLVLVPAAMQLLGRWNWWLPRAARAAAPRRVGRGAGYVAGRASRSGSQRVASVTSSASSRRHDEEGGRRALVAEAEQEGRGDQRGRRARSRA